MTCNINVLIIMSVGYILIEVTCGKRPVHKDGPYDIIHFKIPISVWEKAWSNQPIAAFKSQATIVLPIYVNEDSYTELEDDEVDLQNNNEVENDPQVNNGTDIDQNAEINNDTMIQDAPLQDEETPLETTTLIPETTPQVIEDEEPNNTTDVAGQGIRIPCSCVRRQCGCCTRTILPRLNMNTCGNITFVPRDFLFDVRMTINGRTVLRRRVSASNPPPICFNPPIAPFVEICGILSNIRMQNRNAFACLDIRANMAGFPIYTASFRCFGFGRSGVQSGLRPRPVQSGPPTVNLFGGNNNNNGGGGGSTIFGGGGPLGAIGNAISGILRF